MTTWAEDRATVGIDPSAAPGARTGERAILPYRDRPSCRPTSGTGTNAINPSGRSPEFWSVREHAMPGDGLSAVRNSNRRVLHFRLNQYSLRHALQGMYR